MASGGMDKEQVEVLFKTLKPVLDPDLLYFAYYKGETYRFLYHDSGIELYREAREW